MKRIELAALLSLLVVTLGAPAVAGPPACSSPDTDLDTVIDCEDNCSAAPNASQLDADGDFCGNFCDGDFDQNGLTTVVDFSAFTLLGFGKVSPIHDVNAPHDTTTGGTVNIVDFSQFTIFLFGAPAGPSGTTNGTLACP